MNIIEQIKQHINEIIITTYHKVPTGLTVTLNVDPAKQQFGDLSTNAALIIAKEVQQNPRLVAQTILDKLIHQYIDRSEIAGPGFINIFLTQAAFQKLAQALFDQQEKFFKPATLQPITYNIEFVSANPTGPLHLGHGRGGIIGDVLGNILHFLGHRVTKEFYINDAGAQIVKLGLSFKARCLQQLGVDAPIPEDGYQGDYLISLAQKCVNEYGPALKDEKDYFFAVYAKNHLLEAIKSTLKNYGIQYDMWFSEKTLHESGAITQALATLEKNNHLFIHDDALWFRSTAFGDDKDRVVRRANGELTYVAADIAYLEDKIERGAQKIIMVLGQDHHSYVVRLKAVMAALGHDPNNLDVILYQLVTLKESGELVRMSKRTGHIVALEDIIEAVGADIARFFYLNRKADAHLEFDIALALKHSEENPVYYIQYAYVRMGSILEKAESMPEFANITTNDAAHCNDAEKFLLKKIISLQELLVNIQHNYQVHLLTYYIIELANLFHSYYAANRVLDRELIAQSRARLAMIILLRRTFKTVLDLLGISTPTSM